MVRDLEHKVEDVEVSHTLGGGEVEGVTVPTSVFVRDLRT